MDLVILPAFYTKKRNKKEREDEYIGRRKVDKDGKSFNLVREWYLEVWMERQGSSLHPLHHLTESSHTDCGIMGSEREWVTRSLCPYNPKFLARAPCVGRDRTFLRYHAFGTLSFRIDFSSDVGGWGWFFNKVYILANLKAITDYFVVKMHLNFIKHSYIRIETCTKQYLCMVHWWAVNLSCKK